MHGSFIRCILVLYLQAMEINKEHRTALLNELDKAQEDLKTERAGLASFAEGEVLCHHFEVGIFLAQLRVEAIKKALVDNELYNF